MDSFPGTRLHAGRGGALPPGQGSGTRVGKERAFAHQASRGLVFAVRTPPPFSLGATSRLRLERDQIEGRHGSRVLASHQCIPMHAPHVLISAAKQFYFKGMSACPIRNHAPSGTRTRGGARTCHLTRLPCAGCGRSEGRSMAGRGPACCSPLSESLLAAGPFTFPCLLSLPRKGRVVPQVSGCLPPGTVMVCGVRGGRGDPVGMRPLPASCLLRTVPLPAPTKQRPVGAG